MLSRLFDFYECVICFVGDGEIGDGRRAPKSAREMVRQPNAKFLPSFKVVRWQISFQQMSFQYWLRRVWRHNLRQERLGYPNKNRIMIMNPPKGHNHSGRGGIIGTQAGSALRTTCVACSTGSRVMPVNWFPLRLFDLWQQRTKRCFCTFMGARQSHSTQGSDSS